LHQQLALSSQALLVALLIQHQKVDESFNFLPTDGNSTAGAIIKAIDIPNDEVNIKKYVKEMHEINNRNNSKRYTVVFFVKVASIMTLGMMKKNYGLFMWLRDNDVWIKSFNFTTTYGVVNAGFISNINANLHHRDRVNDTIQTAMKKHYPQLEIQLVPTTIKHGLNPQDKCTTHVVSSPKPITRTYRNLVKPLCTFSTSRRTYSPRKSFLFHPQ
jgi:hypothetical protein